MILSLSFIALLGVFFALYVGPLKNAEQWKEYQQFGYLDAPYNPPMKAFGSQEYVVRRDGAENDYGTSDDKGSDAYSRTRDRLAEKVENQQTFSCAVCESSVNEVDDACPMFREYWKSSHFCFFPYDKTHMRTEAFCSAHRSGEKEVEQEKPAT